MYSVLLMVLCFGLASLETLSFIYGTGALLEQYHFAYNQTLVHVCLFRVFNESTHPSTHRCHRSGKVLHCSHEGICNL
jgi:hypothetical protein